MRQLRHITIVREDRLGDSCVSLPVLEALHHLSPETRVTWICQSPWRELFEGHPVVDSVLVKPRKPNFLEALKTAQEIRALRTDAILLLRGSRIWRQIAWLSGCPLRIGPTPRAPLAGLTHDSWTESRRHIHIARRALDGLATTLDVEVPDFPAVLKLSETAQNAADASLQQLKLPSDFFIVQVGSGGSNKTVPTSIFAKVAEKVNQETGLIPVLTGAPGQEDLAREFGINYRDTSLSLIGRTDLPTLATVLKASKFILSLDTGTVHLGAAVGRGSVVLMPKIAYDIQEWKPWMVDYEAVRPQQFCPQCSRQGCRVGEAICATSFSEESVFEACRSLLNRTA